MDKSLRTTNETIFAAHIDFSVDNAYHTALCATNATPAHMEAVQSLREIKFINIIAGKMAVIAEMNQNDNGVCY